MNYNVLCQLSFIVFGVCSWMQEIKTLEQNKTVDISFAKIIKKIGANPLLLAFLINLASFLLSILFFDIKYEVSDDYITDAVLSGAFGTGYDPQLLFGNVILGYILVFLYKLIPSVSFYFLMLITLDFIATTVIMYMLFKHKTNIITVCMAILFMIFYADDLYLLIQFTKTSAVAGIAGGLLILHGLWEAEKHKAGYILSGILLMTAGSMIRFETIYIYAAFLVIAFVFHVLSRFPGKEKHNGKSKERPSSGQIAKQTGIRFAVCVLIVGSMFGLSVLGEWIRGLDETHAGFNSFHSIRCSITDTQKPDFELVEAEYNEIGLDVIDYIMLCSWNFSDREIYNDELIKKVAAIHSKAVSEIGTPVSAVIENITQRQQFLYPAALALYIFTGLGLLLSKKRFYHVAILITAAALIIAFVFYGRTMYRVDWSVFFCAASCVITGFAYDDNSRIAGQKKTVFGKKISTVGLYIPILVVLLIVSKVPRVITRYQLLNCPDEVYRKVFANTLEYSGDYIPDKVAFPSVSRRLSPELIEHMMNDQDHYYVVDFATGIQDFYFNYDPWIRPEQGLFEHYSYFGGCTMRHPGERSALMANGADPDNPFKSLLIDNIYLVDNWGAECKIAYVRKYFCPDAEISLVDVIDGYKIWKVTDPGT